MCLLGSCEGRDSVRSRERFAGLYSLGAFMWRVSRPWRLHNPCTRFKTYKPGLLYVPLCTQTPL
jgi:hypothetical protein